MLSRQRFNEMITEFQYNFTDRYDKYRLELMFNELEWLEEHELDRVLRGIVLRFNREYLPTINDIKIRAYHVAPQAVTRDHMETSIGIVCDNEHKRGRASLKESSGESKGFNIPF